MKTVWTHISRGYRRWETYISSMEGAQEPVASSGISFHLWRLYQHFWLLICLLFPIVSFVQKPPAPVRLLLAALALAFFATSYTWLMWPHPASSEARTRSRAALILFAVLIVLVLVLSLAYGLAFLWLFIGVSAIAGVLLPVRRAFLAVTILMFLPLIISVSTSGGVTGVDWLQLIPLILLVRGLGLDMIGLARLSSALRELHAARAEGTRLAVVEERLRLARDLHDLLGHTLSMITLKSELAGRLLTQEPARAAQEIREVERVARQALREVREAVAGYRQPTLESELEGARQLLEAAGIDYQFEQPTGVFPPSIGAVLAWAVREGVTNVIRHSRARWCRIRITHEKGISCVEVTNDGYWEQGQEPLQQATGSGLAGLTERVRVHGGRIEALPIRLTESKASHERGVVSWNTERGVLRAGGKEGFRLLVELPIQRSGKAVREDR